MADDDQGNNEAGDQGGDAHWTNDLSNVDLKTNPTLQKYDSQEAANQGHLALQASMGADKQVWPKDENDTERWAEVHKRMGVPEKADGYGLEAFSNPEGAHLFDKASFQEMMHKHSAPDAVAKGLWGSYTESIKAGYADAKVKFDENVAASKADLMSEWGEAYEAKVAMGQNVIDTLGNSQEQKDALTVSLAQSSDGLRFLAEIGSLLKESSIGGFQETTNFTLSPTEAREELDRIRGSAEYNSKDDKVRAPVIERMNSLMKMAGPRI